MALAAEKNMLERDVSKLLVIKFLEEYSLIKLILTRFSLRALLVSGITPKFVRDDTSSDWPEF